MYQIIDNFKNDCLSFSTPSPVPQFRHTVWGGIQDLTEMQVFYFRKCTLVGRGCSNEGIPFKSKVPFIRRLASGRVHRTVRTRPHSLGIIIYVESEKNINIEYNEKLLRKKTTSTNVLLQN